MLVYGKNSCKEYLKNSKEVKKIYLSNNFNDKDLNLILKNLEITPKILDKNELDRLADGNHQGIIIDIGEYSYTPIEDIMKDNGLIIMLDHLEDTHNFGAIIRTCEAAGVDGIIIPKDRSVGVNSTVMKTSSGAATNMKICMVNNLVNTIKYLQKNNYWIVGTDFDGENYTDIDYNMNTCIVIGNEGKGISELVKKSCDFNVSIPMNGKVNSLNASVAAGILIYEVLRQRRK